MYAMIRIAPPNASQVSIWFPKIGSERQVYIRLQPLTHRR